MDDLYHITWNNHNSTIIYNIQRLHGKEIFCDATIVCDGKYFPVHKLVLSSCSEYFEEIFEKTPCRHPFIVLKDVDIEDLEALLNFMYKGEVNIPQDRLSFFIKAGETLKIKELSVSDELNKAKQNGNSAPFNGKSNLETNIAELPATGDRSFLTLTSSNELSLTNESRSMGSFPERYSLSKDRSLPIKNVSLEERKRQVASLCPLLPKRIRRLEEEHEEKMENLFSGNNKCEVKIGNEPQQSDCETIEKSNEDFEESSLLINHGSSLEVLNVREHDESETKVKMEEFIGEKVDVLIDGNTSDVKGEPYLDSSTTCDSSSLTTETFELVANSPDNQGKTRTLPNMELVSHGNSSDIAICNTTLISCSEENCYNDKHACSACEFPTFHSAAGELLNISFNQRKDPVGDHFSHCDEGTDMM